MNKTGYITCFWILASSLCSQNYNWVKNVSSVGAGAGYGIFADATGNVYATGTFSGTSDFDPGTTTVNLTSAGDMDAFIQKLDASGNFLWARSVGGTLEDNANTIVTDSQGNVYVAGSFKGSGDFDPGSGTCSFFSHGQTDVFILKLDASGNFLWAKQIGGSNDESSYSIALDHSGNICLSGSFYGVLDLDPGAANHMVNTTGSYGGYLLKLDASGNFLWGECITGSNSFYGFSIGIDILDHIYMTGYYNGTTDFDPGPGTYTMTPQSINSFILKLDASGSFLWAKTFGSANTVQAQALALDHNGNSYVTGYFVNTGDFDPGPGVSNLVSNGFTDIFVVKFDAQGNYKWAGNMGSINGDQGLAIAVDDHTGDIYTTGRFKETADFDPGAAVVNLVAASIGYDDIFISRLDSLGNFVSAKRIGSTNGDYGAAIACDSQSNIYLTGTFFGTVDFNPNAGVANLTIPSGSVGIFILKLGEMEITGLGDYTSVIQNVSIYPNPNTGRFAVIAKDIFYLKLLNSTGQLIESINTNHAIAYYFDQDLPAGIYFLTGQTSQGTINQKIVITN